MFTGIITDIGTVSALERAGDIKARIATGYDTGSIDIEFSQRLSKTRWLRTVDVMAINTS